MAGLFSGVEDGIPLIFIRDPPHQVRYETDSGIRIPLLTQLNKMHHEGALYFIGVEDGIRTRDLRCHRAAL